MLSIKRCREILGRNCNLSDEQLMALRDGLYSIAEIAISSANEKANMSGNEPTCKLSAEAKETGEE